MFRAILGNITYFRVVAYPPNGLLPNVAWCQIWGNCTAIDIFWYAKKGNYYLPELALPTEEEKAIGIWGQRHLRYLKENKPFIYLNLLTSGRLNEYLASIDEQAEDMFFRLVKEYADREG